jgi:peroxiredoxin
MGWPKRLVYLTVAMLLAGSLGLGGDKRAGNLALLDLSGRHVNPLRTAHARALVFVFTRSDCPISNRYAPEVRRLHEKFAPRGVAFWLVYPDPNETPQAIREHLKEYSYAFGALRDPEHSLVKLTEAKVTPEAAVFVPGGRMVYHGRIDDLYVDFGKTRRTPTTHDLEQAVESVLEGKPVKEASTPAIGCFISDLK